MPCRLLPREFALRHSIFALCLRLLSGSVGDAAAGTLGLQLIADSTSAAIWDDVQLVLHLSLDMGGSLLIFLLLFFELLMLLP